MARRRVAGARVPGEAAPVGIRFRGRTLDRRHQEVRPHIAYLVFASGIFHEHGLAFDALAKHVEALSPGKMQTLGLFYNGGWRITPFSRKEASLLRDAMQLASQALHLESIVTIVLARGVTYLPVPKPAGHFPSSEVLCWVRRRHEDKWLYTNDIHDQPSSYKHRSRYVTDDVVIYEAEPGDTERPFPAQQAALEMQEVDESIRDWREVCFIQFVGTTNF